MKTWHKIIFGDSRDMHEIEKPVHLMITSPPYFNAPFDYPELFKNYDEFLDLIRALAKELKKVLAKGRIACFITQDVRIKGKLYPICSDIIRIMIEEGFLYRDKIIWRKPEGYIRISRRSGVLIQHQLPMYFYPDNIFEEILIFQKGEFEYETLKKFDEVTLKNSRINIDIFNKEKWYLSVWDITNVLPLKGRLEEGIAAFPEEIPNRLIRLFSYVGETVLDPFVGSGTTSKVAMELGRNSYGYEIDLELKPIILKKLGVAQKIEEDKYLTLTGNEIEIIIRKDAKRLRTFLQKKIKEQRSVIKQNK
jgi:DNA modification methylase